MIFPLVRDAFAAGVLGLWTVRAAVLEKGAWAWLADLASGFWPPGPYFAGNMARSAGSLLLALFLLFVFDSAGLRLLRFLLGRKPEGAERAGAVFAGYAAVSGFLLGAACAGIWFNSVLLLGLAGTAILGLPEARRAAGEWLGLARRSWNGAGPSAMIALSCVAAVWLFLLLVPEIHIDCMQYHLALPLQMGVWNKIPGTGVYNGLVIPVASDLPNAFPLLFGLDPAATIMRPVMVLAGAYAFLAALGVGLPPAYCAVLLVLSVLSPDARFVLATAKNDAVVCGYVLVFCAFLVKSGIMRRGAGSQGLVFAAALFSGMVLSSKYILLPMVFALLLAAVYGCPHAKRGRLTVLMALGVLIPFLPWALKSYIFYADPLYPAGLMYLPKLLGDPSTNENTRLLYETLIRHDRPPGSVFAEIGWLTLKNSPLFLAGALVLIRRPPAGSGLLPAALIAGLGGLFLASRGAIDAAERYAYPAFTALGLLAGAALFSAPAGEAAGRKRGAVLAFISALLAFLCLLRLVSYQRILYTGLFASEYHAGKVSAADYRMRGMYTYGAALPAIREAVADGAAGHRLLLIGETLSFGLPLRAVMDNLEAPFVWKAVRESGSWGRIAVRFKQAGISLVVYNLPVAGWTRFGYSPYDWTAEMLSRYKEFARRYYRIRWFNGYCMPFYGSDWLVSVSSRALPPRSRILFLPGAERAYSYAALAAANGHFRDAVIRFAALGSRLGDVSWTDSLLGGALVGAGEYSRAYPLLKRSIGEGLLDESNLLDWAVSAGRLGKIEEMKEALRRADAYYPITPSEIGNALGRAGLLEAARAAGFKARSKWRPWWPG